MRMKGNQLESMRMSENEQESIMNDSIMLTWALMSKYEQTWGSWGQHVYIPA